MFAALFGAVMSSLDSMLNSASTIFTKDLYERHWARKPPSQRRLVTVGRLATGSFVVFACLLAPELRHMGAIYDYMQQAWNFIWPGILAAFLWGIVLPRAPSAAGVAGLVAGVPLYAFFNLGLGVPYLNAAALSFVVASVLMLLITWRRPLEEPRALPDAAAVKMKPAPGARLAGLALVAATVALYLVFW
jgi:SSS family solute:Na+ symporter